MHFKHAIGLALLLLVAGCNGGDRDGAPWYKGNLHTHSLWSDGDDFPEHIAQWYRDHGYQFLGISDHNTAQQGEKWVKYTDLYRKGAKVSTDRYLAEYDGRARVRGDRTAGTQEIRLTPFKEYRPWLERAGKFLLVPSEEISDSFEKKPIHMNATNVGETIKPRGGGSVVEVIANNLRAIREQAERLDRPILPHLNHPNFGWGVTAEELAEVVEEHFFEVYNGHPEVNQPGDTKHPSVERIWDIANTIRLTALNAPPLMGLATDDTHHYHVGGMTRAAAGRGWICVRAEALTPEALIAAMREGDFYASTGVVLDDVKYDPATGTIDVSITGGAGSDDERFTTQFIGTPVGVRAFRQPATQPTTKPVLYTVDPDRVGIVLATVEGRRATYKLKGDELYVRAVVTSSRPPDNPSFKGQKRQAWTQPVGWERRVGSSER